jgi:multiple sugar transport system permease protein
MPLIAGAVPLSPLLYKVGLYSTLPGLIVVYVSINLSFAVWLLTIVLRNLPRRRALYVDLFVERATRVR